MTKPKPLTPADSWWPVTANDVMDAYEKASRLVYGSNEHMLALRTADDMRYALNQNEAAA